MFAGTPGWLGGFARVCERGGVRNAGVTSGRTLPFQPRLLTRGENPDFKKPNSTGTAAIQ